MNTNVNINGNIKEREKKYHDRVFREENESREKTKIFYSIGSPSLKYYLNRLKNIIGPNKNVLEYGCGAGGDLELYKSTGSNLYGIDISSVAISLAQKKSNKLKIKSHYFLADAEKTGLKNNYFDAIVGNAIIHHLNINNAMSELSRIIKPNGKCIFQEPMGHNPIINLYRYLTPHMRTPDEHPILKRDFDIMKKYFDKIEVKYFYLFSLSALAFRRTILFDIIYKSLTKLDEILINILPWIGKYSWVSVIILSKPIKR